MIAAESTSGGGPARPAPNAGVWWSVPLLFAAPNALLFFVFMGVDQGDATRALLLYAAFGLFFGAIAGWLAARLRRLGSVVAALALALFSFLDVMHVLARQLSGFPLNLETTMLFLREPTYLISMGIETRWPRLVVVGVFAALFVFLVLLFFVHWFAGRRSARGSGLTCAAALVPFIVAAPFVSGWWHGLTGKPFLSTTISSLFKSKPFASAPVAPPDDAARRLEPWRGEPCALDRTRVPEHPNVVVIVLESVGATHLPFVTGYARDTMPNLRRLAERGALYVNAYAAGTNTSIALPAIIESTLPNDFRPLDGDGRRRGLLFQTFRDSGYRTGAFIAQDNDHSRMWLDYPAEYLDAYADSLSYLEHGGDPSSIVRHHGEFHLDDTINFDRALGFVAEAGTKPFLLFIHAQDTHYPYRVSPPDDPAFPPIAQSRQIDRSDPSLHVNLYDSSLHSFDVKLGRFLERLEGLVPPEQLLIVVTADHGETFMEHGDVIHNNSVYEELERVPLLVVGPGVPACRNDTLIASHVDILPTMAQLARVPLARSVAGKDLFSFRPESPLANFALFVLRGGRQVAGLRTGPFVAIEYLDEDRSEVYDLDHDPREHKNLYSPDDALSTFLMDRLRRQLRAMLLY